MVLSIWLDTNAYFFLFRFMDSWNAHITYENALALFIQGLIFLLISGAGFTSISSHAR